MADIILSMEGMSGEGTLTSGVGGDVQPKKDDISELDDNEIESLFKKLINESLVEDETTLKNVALSQGSKPRIQRALRMLHRNQNFKIHLEPKVLFLGCQPTKRSKLRKRLAAMFIRDYHLKKCVYNDIFTKIDKFNECYDERFVRRTFQEFDDKEWSWKLLVDGCALLFYIVCYVLDNLHKLNMAEEGIALAINDIFLLENQLPYDLLDLLMKRSKLGELVPSLIHDFVKLHCIVQVNIETIELVKAYSKPDHLLGLMWAIMRGTNPNPNPGSKFARQFSRALSFTSYKRHMHSDLMIDQEKKKGSIRWSPSHSMKELKKVWINFKPGVMLKDISFSPGIVSGEIKLPRLIIDDLTAVKLSNLIAYEMCPDFQNDLELTSYICFLNSFVEKVDVTELRSAGVLINYLSSDGEVLQLFRDTASTLVPNPAIYLRMQEEIQKHFKRKGRTTIATWFAEAALVYFKTPWSTIAVLAAAFAILLTMVQTYFAIFPQK